MWPRPTVTCNESRLSHTKQSVKRDFRLPDALPLRICWPFAHFCVTSAAEYDPPISLVDAATIAATSLDHDKMQLSTHSGLLWKHNCRLRQRTTTRQVECRRNATEMKNISLFTNTYQLRNSVKFSKTQKRNVAITKITFISLFPSSCLCCAHQPINYTTFNSAACLSVFIILTWHARTSFYFRPKFYIFVHILNILLASVFTVCQKQN